VKPCQRNARPSRTVHTPQRSKLVSHAAVLPPAAHGGRSKHLISCVDQLVQFDMEVVEFAPERFQDPPQSLRPPLHAHEVGLGEPGGGLEFELR
jgi:hypothetical protein